MTIDLDIQELKIDFVGDDETVRAVDGINLQVKRGESLGLVGESGCGKSVTSLAIMGLLPKNSKITGNIFFRGEDLTRKTDKEMEKIRGNKISMIFQDPMTSLNPVFTIADQLQEAIRLHQGGTRKEIFNRAVELLDLVKIPDAKRRMLEYPHQMSGGIRQRIMIAMALACNPSLLIADEPTTALDVTVQAQILALIDELQREFDTSVMLISHDLGVIAQVADRVAVMYAGQVVEQGMAEDLFSSPKHPYTRGLLDTIPRIDGDKKELKEIKGMVPDLSRQFWGCRFSPRCPEAREECKAVEPSPVECGNSLVRCLLYT